MKLKYSTFFTIAVLLFNSSPSLLRAADEESLKKLEVLLPSPSENQAKPLDLSGVDMRSYDLCSSKKDGKIDFRKANLQGANFSGMEICHVNFEGANLEQANFEGATITKCNFRYVKGPVNFTDASIRNSGFNHSKLEKSLFAHATLESTGFDFADLRHTNFDQSTLIMVNFYSADLTGYSQAGARMEKTSFEKSQGTSWFD